jgi:hypothetical protein
MRNTLILVPLAVLASPAAAQPAESRIEIPKELTDPAWADRLTNVLQVLSKSMLELPVGEVEAALEGRQPTAADKRKTVRTETRMSERELGQQIEAARPMMQGAMKAMTSALPAMMKGLEAAGQEMEKATANLPQPGYPKR